MVLYCGLSGLMRAMKLITYLFVTVFDIMVRVTAERRKCLLVASADFNALTLFEYNAIRNTRVEIRIQPLFFKMENQRKRSGKRKGNGVENQRKRSGKRKERKKKPKEILMFRKVEKKIWKKLHKKRYSLLKNFCEKKFFQFFGALKLLHFFTKSRWIFWKFGSYSVTITWRKECAVNRFLNWADPTEERERETTPISRKWINFHRVQIFLIRERTTSHSHIHILYTKSHGKMTGEHTRLRKNERKKRKVGRGATPRPESFFSSWAGAQFATRGIAYIFSDSSYCVCACTKYTHKRVTDKGWRRLPVLCAREGIKIFIARLARHNFLAAHRHRHRHIRTSVHMRKNSQNAYSTSRAKTSRKTEELFHN